MRFYTLIAFFALIVLAAAQAGHGEHGGAKHGVQQRGNAWALPPNGTIVSTSNCTTANSTTEASNSETSTTEASSTPA